MRHLLRPAPGPRPAAITSLEAEILRRPEGALSLRYDLASVPGGLRLPAPAAATQTDALWKHTCFEAFVKPAGGEVYFEFNLAPSTQWAVYRFAGYRDGMAPVRIDAPWIALSQRPDGLVLTADLDLGKVAGLARRAWQVGLTAVIEAADGTLSYWSLAHPPGRPDFHHADCFALEVPAPEAS
jgi:hypothetical protein